MSQFYKLTEASPLGEPWTPNIAGASELQNWWCKVEGEDWNVMINKQVGNTLSAGQHVYGDLLKATSAKGNHYWKFKSAKVPEGVQRPADSPAQATAQQAVGVQDMSATVPAWFIPFAQMIEFVYKEMKGVETRDDTPLEQTQVLDEAAKSEQLEVVGVELDEETKKKLDEVFGEPLPSEE